MRFNCQEFNKHANCGITDRNLPRNNPFIIQDTTSCMEFLMANNTNGAMLRNNCSVGLNYSEREYPG